VLLGDAEPARRGLVAESIGDVGKAAANGVEGELAAGGGVMSCNEVSGLAARHKAQILEAVDRQMREGVVDHQMVDVAMGDAGQWTE